jgi:hypothetical protein
MENIFINDSILKVFQNGEVWKFGFKGNSKEKTWHLLAGTIGTQKNGYKQHQTEINGIACVTARLLAYAFLRFDLDDEEDSIDHININSTDNHISNLRCASKTLQQLNRNIESKGWVLLPSGRYQAGIRINGKRIHLGTYDTKEEAHQVYLVEYNKKLNEIN